MKLNTKIRTAMATAMSLGLGLGIVACSRDYTAAYVYAVSASNGTVAAFGVDYQSGVLTQISGSPFATTLTNPGTLIASPSGKNVYILGGTQNSEVEEFAVGSDGKLYGQNTYNITGTYPTAAAIDSAGAFLYVTYTYQIGNTPASGGNGGVTIFKINSDGTLAASPANLNVGNNPVAVSVAAPTNGNVFAYVLDAENSTFSPGAAPQLLGYQQNTTTGVLTPVAGTVFNAGLKTYTGITAGVSPSAMAIDPTGRYVYVTDKLNNEIYGYQIATATGGTLSTLTTSPYSTGLYPLSITIEPRGKYVYVANYNSNTVSSYSLVSATGALSGTASVGNFTTATGPTCVTVDPALGIYLYTSNFLDGSISGGKLNADTGALAAVPATPFPTSILPSCVTSVANGAHAVQFVSP